MQPNLDTVLEPRGSSRLFLEDDPSVSDVEDSEPTSVEYDASMPSLTIGHLVVLPFSCFCFWF